MEKFILRREEVCLLVIDIQERLVPVMKYKDDVIKNTNILLEGAKEMGIPVIVTEQYPQGLGETVNEVKKHLGDAKIFTKNSFTAYIEEVRKEIESLGRNKIIIVGMETHVCIYQTVRDLLDHGYEVYIARDGVCSRSKTNYLNGLEQMREMGAVISNTETIIFDLLKLSGTPEFKIMSKLIK